MDVEGGVVSGAPDASSSVKAPAGRPAPAEAERLMEEVLYLPLYPSSSASEMREMARVVRELEHQPDRTHAAVS